HLRKGEFEMKLPTPRRTKQDSLLFAISFRILLFEDVGSPAFRPCASVRLRERPVAVRPVGIAPTESAFPTAVETQTPGQVDRHTASTPQMSFPVQLPQPDARGGYT